MFYVFDDKIVLNVVVDYWFLFLSIAEIYMMIVGMNIDVNGEYDVFWCFDVKDEFMMNWRIKVCNQLLNDE